jgi:acetyl esterase
MTYAIDPELAPWIAMLPAVSFADIEEVRSGMAAMTAMAPAYEPPIPIDLREIAVPGPEGAPDVAVRVYTPVERDGDLPGLLYIHGGGFALGHAADFDHETTRLAAEIPAVVVSVDYRLAPEHPFPAPVEDCYAALVWTAGHAAELGIDPARLGVGGDSAGGGLAAATALLARDRGGPALCFQYLGIPELDDRLETPSMRDYVDTPLWNRPNAEASWDYYLGGPGVRGTEKVSPYAVPARAEDLSGLPPAFVTVCQFDPLRDEGMTYAQRLLQAGVAAELHCYPGTFHGSGMVADAAVTRRMIADEISALRRGLSPAKPD